MGRGSSGGSRGGGSHHSSSSSRGGSFRSSSGSGRGGYSSGFHSHSGHSYSSTHVHVNNYGGGYYAPSYGRSYGRSTFSLAPIVLIFAFVFIGMIVLGCLQMIAGGGGITKSTIERTPLSPQYVETSSFWFDDHIGWIRSPATIEKGLRAFYTKTGVQPYVVITETVNGSYTPTGQQVLDYANEVYDDTFNDEGHLVFVFQCRDNDTRYTMAAATGAMAKTVVDNEALEILYDYFDYYFYSDVTDDEMFANAFSDAADRMMRVTPNYSGIAIIVLLVIVALIVVFFILKAVFKRQKEKAAEDQAILNTPISEIHGTED